MFSKLLAKLSEDNYAISEDGHNAYYIKCSGLSLNHLVFNASEAGVSCEIDEGKAVKFNKKDLYITLLYIELQDKKKEDL